MYFSFKILNVLADDHRFTIFGSILKPSFRLLPYVFCAGFAKNTLSRHSVFAESNGLPACPDRQGQCCTFRVELGVNSFFEIIWRAKYIIPI